MKAAFVRDADLATAIAAASLAITGADRTLTERELEVAVLERNVERRAFRRFEGSELLALLSSVATAAPVAAPVPAPVSPPPVADARVVSDAPPFHEG